MLQIMALVFLATIFSGLFCFVGVADKNANPIFKFWSFIIFGGGVCAFFFAFVWFALPFRISPQFSEWLAPFGFLFGGLFGCFVGWKYAVRLENKRTTENYE